MSFINYQDPRPIYEQITDYYEKMIVNGVLKKDEQMPSVRQIAAELSVNPNTIQKAYAYLESRGFIYSVKGKGSFVSENTVLIREKKKEWTGKLYEVLKGGREIGISVDECIKLTKDFFDAGQKALGENEKEGVKND